eukprot:g1328.t1
MSISRFIAVIVTVALSGLGSMRAQQPSTYDIKGYVEPWQGFETPSVNILGKCFSGLGFTQNCKVCSYGSGDTTPTPRFQRKKQFIDDAYDPAVQSTFAGCPPCEADDHFFDEPHLCPTGPEYASNMNRNANCASQCADLCAEDAAGCDAYTYVPQRCQRLQSGEESAVCPFLPPFCALYDFDDMTDGVEGQLDCQEFTSYGGGFPYGQDLFWESTPLKVQGEEPWCLNCCDNRRMAYNFKDTFVMQCDYDTNAIGLAMGSIFTLPTSLEDDIQDLIFRFAKRETLDDETGTTDCILNRHLLPDVVEGRYKRAQNYLVGYNLTIGVAERRSGLNYWKGVDWCYVEPIVSTRDYWQRLRSEDTVKFLEIITMTNLPDPLLYDRQPPERWHAWQRRLGHTNAASPSALRSSSTLLIVVFAAALCISLRASEMLET